MSYLLLRKQVLPQPNVAIGQIVILHILDAPFSNLGPRTFQPNKGLYLIIFFSLSRQMLSNTLFI